MGKNVDYDPNVIQQHANKLYEKAHSIIFIYSIFFLLIGLGLGFFLDSTFSISIFRLVAPIVGCFLGYVIGSSMAFNLKLKAQLALCQVEIEKNTRK